MTVLKKFGLGRFAALLVLMAMVALRVADPAIVQIARAQAFDLYQRIKPRDYKPVPVAILDIDEASIRKYGQWPWPRTKMAEMVDRLTKLGVGIVGFDIVFSEPDRLSPDVIAKDNDSLDPKVREALASLPNSDAVFAQSIKKSRVVLGQTGIRSNRNAATFEGSDFQDAPIGFRSEGVDVEANPRTFLRIIPPLLQNKPELEKAAMGRGVFTATPDPDGIYRQINLIYLVEEKLRLALTTEMLRVASGGPRTPAFARYNQFGLTRIAFGRNQVATDAQGRVWPYFTHTRPSRFISAVDVFEGTVDPRRIRGHFLLVGTSAIGLEDFRDSPMGYQMPGVEIHAQVLENILAGTMLYRPSYAFDAEVIAMIVVGLLAIVAVPFLGAAWSFLAATFIIGGFISGSYFAFDQYRMLIDPVLPTATVLLLFILLATFNYLREERKRREIKSAFGQYVSPALVSELQESPEGLKLGGETRDLTILFSDVRGFTAISESFKDNPQGLTELMNEFLTVLSKAILKYDGTIDKFMGDAVMAFWNAPLPHPNHARAACNAALEMIAAVDTLNEENRREHEARVLSGDRRKDHPLHAINIGIGINSGDCVVGNMGSEDRFDYTCLGDAVNLASRLEGQSKPYGVLIIMGEVTAHAVADEMAILEIDRIRVKGKQEPETIFGLYGGPELAESEGFGELNQLNADMLAKYRAQDWESCSALLELLQDKADALSIDLQGYLFVYETRIIEFEQNPPGVDWDGVYTATSK
ncbi:MAG: adenylate/guanylate cyclase domain-containing protein [Pseudomonadota bacterium]